MNGYALTSRTRAGHTAVIHETEQLTHGELDERSTQLAAAVRAAGAAGTEVECLAVALPNCIELLEAFAASAKLGVPVLTLDPSLDVASIREACRLARSRVVIAPADRQAEVAPAVEPDGIVALSVGDDYEQRLATAAPPASSPYRWPAASPIRYQAGSIGGTGELRREPTSVDALEAHCEELVRRHGLGQDDVHLVAAALCEAEPFDHCAATTYAGGTVVLMDAWDPSEFLRLVESHRVTTTFLARPQFDEVAALDPRRRRRFDTTSLRALFHEGPTCPAEVAARLRRLFTAADLATATHTDG